MTNIPRADYLDASCSCGRNGADVVSCASAYERIMDRILMATLQSLQRNALRENEEPTKSLNISAFPTEQAIRQKAQKKTRILQLESDGMTKDEIKNITKRKAVIQEKHYDDCGSDTCPIEFTTQRTLLIRSNSSYRDTRDYCFYDWDTGELTDSESEDDFRDYHYDHLLSSEIDEDHSFFIHRGSDSHFIHFTYLVDTLQKPTLRGKVDVVEIFGGGGGLSKISVRRKLRTGRNFDVVSGCDLSVWANQEEMIRYITVHRPLVIIGGPPCTSFSSWSRYHRRVNPESFDRSRAIGEKLANLMARIASMQIVSGRFFLIENPKSSDLFKLPSFQKLWNTNQVGSITLPQCALGLVSPEGKPILKWTTLWSNSRFLLEPFANLSCCHSSHGELEGFYNGVNRTKLV